MGHDADFRLKRRLCLRTDIYHHTDTEIKIEIIRETAPANINDQPETPPKPEPEINKGHVAIPLTCILAT